MYGWVLVGKKSALIKDVDTFIEGLENEDIQVEKIFAEDICVTTEPGNTILIKEKKRRLPDFAVAAFFGDYNYHNHAVVQLLEQMGIYCINGYSCLIHARDKLKSLLLLKQQLPHILLPKTYLYDSYMSQEFVNRTIGFPLIVKINHGAKGNGVHLVDDYDNLCQTIDYLGKKYKDEILIQEFVASSRGRDLRIIICGGQIITSFVRYNPNSFKSNLNSGGTLEFYKLPNALESMALEIAEVLEIKLGSVDFLLDGERFIFCEANSMPGLSYVKLSKDQNLTDPLKTIGQNIKNQVINHQSQRGK